jgi:hypothetical protein
MAKQPMPDVVIVLPGIMGSVLQKDGRDIWAINGGAILRGLLSLGGSIQDLALTDDDPSEDDLGDGVIAARLMPDLHLIPGFWTIDGYGGIANSIKKNFEVEAGANYFEFPYDWRRDNRVAGRQLREASHVWLRDWRERSGNDEAKLVLLAHSMGGLVSRAFLELEDGWRDTRMLVTFGTPYRGSLNALDFMANGFKKKVGPVTLLDLSKLLSTFTSVYQLLPIYPSYDPGDGGLLRVTEATDIPNLDQAQAAAALGFHHQIRDAVDAHQTDQSYIDDGYSIYPVVGIEQPTLQSGRLEGEKVVMLREAGGQDLGGDGTVPRVSAQPLEWQDAAQGMFSAEVHGSLQNSAAVLTQVKGLLTATQIDLSQFRAPPFKLGLDVEDLFGTDESIPIAGRTNSRSARLSVAVIDADSGREVAQARLGNPDAEGWRAVEVPPQPEGVYRCVLSSDSSRDTVTGIFTVLGAAD